MLGKVFKTNVRKFDATGPPPGYDTFWGVKSNTGDFNWDEVCLYKEDGLKPIVAVTYTVDA